MRHTSSEIHIKWDTDQVGHRSSGASGAHIKWDTHGVGHGVGHTRSEI